MKNLITFTLTVLILCLLTSNLSGQTHRTNHLNASNTLKTLNKGIELIEKTENGVYTLDIQGATVIGNTKKEVKRGARRLKRFKKKSKRKLNRENNLKKIKTVVRLVKIGYKYYKNNKSTVKKYVKQVF